jgi:hypothetical protein
MIMEQQFKEIKINSFNKALADIDAYKDRILRAVYSPSEMDRALRTYSSTAPAIMLSLTQSEMDPKVFVVHRGAEVLGTNSLSLEDIVSMDGVTRGKLTIHGQSSVSQLVRTLQSLVIKSPGQTIDVDEAMQGIAESLSVKQDGVETQQHDVVEHSQAFKPR